MRDFPCAPPRPSGPVTSDFAHVDILAEPEVRQNLPRYSNWPTFPQVFIDGELVGGCDIVLDLYQTGELQKMTDAVRNRAAG